MPVLPNAWVLRLKDMRKKKPRTPDPGTDNEDEAPVSPDTGPFFPKPVARNSLRKQSPNRAFSPVRPNDLGFGEPRCSSPVNHKAFDIPHPLASPAKCVMRTPSPRRTPSKTPPQARGGHQPTSPASMDSNYTYHTAVTSFRRKSDVSDARSVPKRETLSAGSFRKTAPRVNPQQVVGTRTRHGSLDMDADRQFGGVDDLGGRVSGAEDSKPDPWTEELSKGALVRQQLFIKRRKETVRAVVDPWGSHEMPRVLSDFRRKLAVSDTVSQWIEQAPERGPVTRSFHKSVPDAADCTPIILSQSLTGGHGRVEVDEKLRTTSWGSCSSLTSDDESVLTPSFKVPAASKEDAAKKSLRWSSLDSNATVTSNVKNFGPLEPEARLIVDGVANLLVAESRFGRKAGEAEQNPFQTSYLSDASASESELSAPSRMESDSGSFTRPGSPKSFFPNSSVCSQEATAKTWAQVELLPVFQTEAGASPGTSPDLFDMSREAYRDSATRPVEHLSLSAVARRAKRLADIEALASARRKSFSRQKGNKSHVEGRHPRRAGGGGPGPDVAAPPLRVANMAPARLDDLNFEDGKGHQQRHRRRFSKEEVTMPREVNGVVKESVALVKNSYNPYDDFKESMIEMIVEKDIQESGDLEELLQCYLSLNGEEYHNVIVEVFTEVWREIFESNI